MSVLLCLCAVLVSGAAAAVSALWWHWRRARSMLAHLPSLPSLPLIGNTHLVWGAGENMQRVLMATGKLCDETNKPVYFKLGPVPFLVLSDAADIKTLSNSSAEKPYFYRLNPNFVGNGILTASEAQWKHSSKQLTGSFTPSVVAGYQEFFNQFAVDLVDDLKMESGKEPFDVLKKYIGVKSLKVIYDITVGNTDASENGFTQEYYHAVEQVQQLVVKRGVNVLSHLDFLFWFTPTYRAITKNENYANDIIEKQISKRKEERKAMKKCSSNDSVKKSDSIRSYLDILLDLSETDPIFTPKQIRDEMNTIMFAGHETVATALVMCMLTIGSHADVQKALYKEMTDIFGDSKRAVSKEDLSRMRYCEAVVNETLRLYPTAPAGLRLATQDIRLESCTVPKDTICAFNLWGAGRSRRAWGADAALFRPERWLDGAVDTAHFIPFSTGKRTCMGKRYAIAMLKTALAHCVRDLVLKADISKLRFATYITMQPVSGHYIQVQSRN